MQNKEKEEKEREVIGGKGVATVVVIPVVEDKQKRETFKMQENRCEKE